MPMLTRWNAAAGAPQLAQVRRSLEGEGMITAWWSELGGRRTPQHAHAFPETKWVISGFLRITADGQLFDLGPGDRLDLPSETPYSLEVLGLSPVVYVTGTTDRSVTGMPAPR